MIRAFNMTMHNRERAFCSSCMREDYLDFCETEYVLDAPEMIPTGSIRWIETSHCPPFCSVDYVIRR
jgi:hypothetical protein